MIDKYVTNTKGHWKIKLLDAYELKRDGDIKKYNKKMPNKFLLWHGSRIGNVKKTKNAFTQYLILISMLVFYPKDFE